jgi:putative transposase
MYLLRGDLARKEPSKQKRRKWVRYERKHSMSAEHIDWHEWDGTDIKISVMKLFSLPNYFRYGLL